MTLVSLLLLSLPAAQSADDVAVLHRPDAERLEAYSASGQLLWTVLTADGSLPADLTPENARGLVDGTWRRTHGGPWLLRGAERASGSAALAASAPPCIVWDAPLPIDGSPPAGQSQKFSEPVHDSGGDAWVALWGYGASPVIEVARSSGHTGAWDPPVTIASAQHEWPDMTIAPNDDVTVVWRQIDGSSYSLYAARRTTAGGWTAPVLVHSSPEFIQYYDVLATAQNDVLLAFHQGSPPVTPPAATRVAVFDHAAGSWGPATTVSPPGTNGFFCALRRSPDGSRVALGYMDWGLAHGIYHHEWNGATKTFAPATVVPASGDASYGAFGGPTSEMAFTVGNDGSSTIFWLKGTGPVADIVGSRYEAGAWGASNPVLVPSVTWPIEMPLQETMDVSPSGHVLGLYPFRIDGSPTHHLYPMHYTPGRGFHAGAPFGAITVELFSLESLARVAFYAGERATAVTNDHALLFAHHWNGAEWSQAQIPVPALSLSHSLSAGAGEALLVDDPASLVRSSWQHGTTAFADLGGGIPGAAGIPHLDAFCDQVAGQAVHFQLVGAAPSAPLVGVLGASQAHLPFAGGTLVPAPDVLLPAVTDAAGELNVPLAWPAGAGSLFTLYYQIAVVDSAALQGVALSNAMAGTTP